MDYVELAVAVIGQGFKDLRMIDNMIKRKRKKPKFPCVCVDYTCNNMNELNALRKMVISDLKTDYCRSMVSFDMDSVIDLYEREISGL